jgi:hypothetical protein
MAWAISSGEGPATCSKSPAISRISPGDASNGILIVAANYLSIFMVTYVT